VSPGGSPDARPRQMRQGPEGRLLLQDAQSLRETAYLMRSPANARRLLDAMERLEAGRGEAHDLIETD